MELIRKALEWATLAAFFIALALLYSAVKNIKITKL